MADITTRKVTILTWQGADDDNEAVIFRYTCDICTGVISTVLLGPDAVCPTHGSPLSYPIRLSVGSLGLMDPIASQSDD